MAGIKIVDLPALGRDLISTDLLEVSLNGSGSRKITGQEIMNASKLAVGSTPIVSGTVGRLLFQNTGDVLGQSANLFWDNTNARLGIGGSPAVYNLDVKGIGIYRGGLLDLQNTTGNFTLSFYPSAGNIGIINSDILRLGRISNSTVFLQGFASGNVGINTTTDAGFRLDVNGTARVKTDLKIETATGGLTIEGDAGGYPTLKINTLRSGTTRRNWMFATEQFNGGDFVLFRSATGGGAANTLVYSIFNNGNVGINTTTDDGFKLDVNGTARVNGLVTATLSNYNSTHLGNTTRGFYIVNSADSIVRAGIEYDGTNAFVQLAGRYGNGAAFFRQNGGNGDISFLRNGVEYGRIFGATGNWGINTFTDAGYKLDVNGTARVSGALTVSGNQILFSGSTSNTYITQNIGTGVGNLSAALCMQIQVNTFPKIIVRDTGASRASTLIVGDNVATTEAAHSSALLEVRSSDAYVKGFLPPRMTNAQRAAIASPAVGLIVYCTDSTEGLYVYKSTGWTFMV